MHISRRRHHSFILFTSVILVLSLLVGCGPSTKELEAVDYTPLPGDDWAVSTPEEQGHDRASRRFPETSYVIAPQKHSPDIVINLLPTAFG